MAQIVCIAMVSKHLLSGGAHPIISDMIHDRQPTSKGAVVDLSSLNSRDPWFVSVWPPCQKPTESSLYDLFWFFFTGYDTNPYPNVQRTSDEKDSNYTSACVLSRLFLGFTASAWFETNIKTDWHSDICSCVVPESAAILHSSWLLARRYCLKEHQDILISV